MDKKILAAVALLAFFGSANQSKAENFFAQKTDHVQISKRKKPYQDNIYFKKIEELYEEGYHNSFAINPSLSWRYALRPHIPYKSSSGQKPNPGIELHLKFRF